MPPTAVVFVGPAASGKSTLTRAYREWLVRNGYSAAVINLDPAVKHLPYKASIDVRDLVRAEELMEREGLGPNGALVRALEIAAEELSKLLEPLSNGLGGVDYVLVDTPGQMEVFLTRDISTALASELGKYCGATVALFVVDASFVGRPADYAFTLLLAIATQLRMGVVTVPVLNKVDSVSGEALSKFTGDLISEYGTLAKLLGGEESTYSEMLEEVLEVIARYGKAAAVPKVSALTGKGLEDLHRLVLEVRCGCGDLT